MPQKPGNPHHPIHPDHMPKSENPSLESEEVKEKEYEMTGGRGPEDEIDEILDEGLPVGHSDGQLRGDQTAGHRGGSWRQNLNRGRS